MGAEGGKYPNNKDYILTVRWINGSGPVLYSIGPPFLERESERENSIYTRLCLTGGWHDTPGGLRESVGVKTTLSAVCPHAGCDDSQGLRWLNAEVVAVVVVAYRLALGVGVAPVPRHRVVYGGWPHHPVARLTHRGVPGDVLSHRAGDEVKHPVYLVGYV